VFVTGGSVSMNNRIQSLYCNGTSFNNKSSRMKILFLLTFLAFPPLLRAQTEGFAQNGGSVIYYRTYGKGVPLLIINGGPGLNSEGFVPLARLLAKNNLTIIYDQRGTGKSSVAPVDSTTITLQEMAGDLEALRIHLAIRQWIVLGHSFGGMLASYYASLHPEQVKALILSSSGGIDLELESYVGSGISDRLSPAEKDSLTYWNGRIAQGDTSYAARLGRGMALAPAYVYNRENIPIIAERLTQGNVRVNDLVWQDLHKIRFDCAPRLKDFDKPVLIIQGKEDIISLKTAEKAHRLLRHSKFVLVDRSAHYGWLDNPASYLQAVNAFLSAVNSG
jgi:proline iminopeptidase